ncbi:ABC transporter ATP-binding protein [Mycobacterium sp. 236(2023)]|uniref:ABC transporter ATP-binding protein n=1 Tax=Mycobacterium sp. 236(2023) TaxID=3038163 RepID=UPI002415439A|nr:ABC transporter ATP-binding protein [Mycobacterium sp. 236(2023)]MDG4667054.1 ABC transporter ATP-binding protein [Mycobacterium sp. 236(2023)]
MTATDVPSVTFDSPVVHARDVRKAFGANVVLESLDLEIRAGEFVAMLGRSGSGKSTFLRALGALDADFDGDVRVPQRRSIVFQDPRLLPWQRVLTNVTVGLPRTRVVRDLARAALAEVRLSGKEEAWPRTLSGGEAQRVALARALVREPQLLLLDEPFGALDALTRIKMHGLLLDLCRKHTPAVLLVTHDVDEAILLADRVIVLTDGAISLDAEVSVPKPRARDSPEFTALRRRLLTELGVDP